MRLSLALLWLLVGLCGALPTSAQEQPPSPPDAAQIQALVQLLRDPVIQSWLQAQVEQSRPAAPAVITSPDGGSLHQAIAARLAQGREFLDQLVDGLPRVPAELARAWLILYLEFSDRGLVS
ncbi:MAG TPA: hypothetical protein VFG43_04555, partial [Geminicoccaceae bacterium]|nr:hypothetical protein [Geminicoccaceae bacterium]